MPDQKQQGQLIQADFFMNSGGLNNTDTPFAVKPGQSIAGYNYEYLATGGITKRNGHTVLNPVLDTQLRSLGYSINITPENAKVALRAAGTKLQTVNPTTGTTMDVPFDTTGASTNVFGANTTQQVVFSTFTNPTETISWFAGGNQGNGVINGYVNGKLTRNGVLQLAAPANGSVILVPDNTPFLSTTGDITSGLQLIANVVSVANLFIGAAVVGAGIPANTTVVGISGNSVAISLPATATTTNDPLTFYGALPDSTLYYYAFSLNKVSSGAQGNASMDTPVTTLVSGIGPTVGNSVDMTFNFTGVDETKYTTFTIFRSSVSGGTPGFTIGDQIVTLPITTTTYTDLGQVQQTAQAVPRNGNQLLDNSALPDTGTYNVLTTWKQRLVTASGSTIYLSDVSKSESWPSLNFITVPSGGPITALGIISYISPSTATTDELLVVFKEREVWTVSGSSLQDWSLLFVDYVGTVAQPLVVFANGFLFFVDYRGIFLYDGSNKPVYLSRLIEYDFSINGDIDLSKLALGNGSFFRKQNEIIWFLSSSTLGEQRLAIKLDLRLSMPAVSNNFVGRIAEAIFIKDSSAYPVYACNSVLPTFEGNYLGEYFFAGDNAGNIFNLYSNGDGDGPNPINFVFKTRIEDFGTIGTAKRYHKVIVWARQSSTNFLAMKYFLGYNIDNNLFSATQEQPISSVYNAPVWDKSLWDVDFWDTGIQSYGPIVYNMANPSIGIEGDALCLEFEQDSYQTPITILGYSVIYSMTGLRK